MVITSPLDDGIGYISQRFDFTPFRPLQIRPFIMMENTDWDSVLQFVSEPMDMEFSDKPIAERTDRNKLSLPSGEPQIPLTPPVRWVFHT